MDKLQGLAAKHGNISTAKSAVAAVLLPLAFGIDTVVIPGPAVYKPLRTIPWSTRSPKDPHCPQPASFTAMINPHLPNLLLPQP